MRRWKLSTVSVGLAIAVLGSLFLAHGGGTRADASAGADLTVSQETFDPFGALVLQSGFNNVVYTGPDQLTVREGLADTADSVSAVWSFRSGGWLLWSASLPEALQGFSSLVFGEPYFVVATEQVTWTRAGFGPDIPTGATLAPGLNFVGYWGETLPITELLSSFQETGLGSAQAEASCVNLIWSFDTEWRLWEPSLPAFLLGFTDLVRGRGYFIDVATPCRFDFPGSETPEPGETALDFGDAPGSYGTTGEGSAVHAIGGPILGETVDAETNGFPSAGADGDDLDGDADDEDGVVFDPLLAPVLPNLVRVVASEAGLLDAFIDVAGDGSFDEPGDQIFTSEPLVAGENLLTFRIPPTEPGETYARFRISSAGGLGPGGDAPDGEVEDLVVSIGTPSVSCDGDWENLTFGSTGSFALDLTLEGLGGTATVTVGGNVFGGSGGSVETPVTLNLLTAQVDVDGDLGFLGQADLSIGLSGEIEGTLTAPTAIPNGIVTFSNAVVALPLIEVDVEIDFQGDQADLAFSRISMTCVTGGAG